MPHPSQISQDMILEKAFEMIEKEGVEKLSWNKLAAALKVAAPSLYHHFDSKTALLRAMNTVTMEKLVEAMNANFSGENPQQNLIQMAHAYREFARQNPSAYALALGNLSDKMRPDPLHMEALAIPLQGIVEKLTGAENSLPILRGFWALIHGFVMLELNQSFRRGGSLEEAFEKAVAAYVCGLSG